MLGSCGQFTCLGTLSHGYACDPNAPHTYPPAQVGGWKTLATTRTGAAVGSGSMTGRAPVWRIGDFDRFTTQAGVTQRHQ